MFRDRRIAALLMPIGCEGIQIEGNKRGTRRLATPHALNRGVQPGDRSFFAGDKADRV